jgi:hypothetical protein
MLQRKDSKGAPSNQKPKAIVQRRFTRVFYHSKLLKYEKLRQTWKERDFVISHELMLQWLVLEGEMPSSSSSAERRLSIGECKAVKGEIALNEHVVVNKLPFEDDKYPFEIVSDGNSIKCAARTQEGRARWVAEIERMADFRKISKEAGKGLGVALAEVLGNLTVLGGIIASSFGSTMGHRPTWTSGFWFCISLVKAGFYLLPKNMPLSFAQRFTDLFAIPKCILPKEVVVGNTFLGTVPAETYVLRDHQTLGAARTLLYLHGGAYCFGGSATHRYPHTLTLPIGTHTHSRYP